MLISVVHAMPAPLIVPQSPSHSPIAPLTGPAADVETQCIARAPFRVTVLDQFDDPDQFIDLAEFVHLDQFEFKDLAKFPSVKVGINARRAITTIIYKIFGDHDPESVCYTNYGGDREERPKAIAFFVLEVEDPTATCGGEWPCVGWHKEADKRHLGASYSIYQIAPALQDKALRLTSKKDEEGTRDPDPIDVEFWWLFPRERFHKAWPDLKKAIDLRVPNIFNSNGENKGKEKDVSKGLKRPKDQADSGRNPKKQKVLVRKGEGDVSKGLKRRPKGKAEGRNPMNKKVSDGKGEEDVSKGLELRPKGQGKGKKPKKQKTQKV
ncbi:hypothetical protein BDP27DRAFT_1428239 [Rhodocollybia butyracea]|uniref:Uncharacterized protein n=1 Tax=Rhodocollybia butyracea TaxID=206335 RepID=A0A9P5PHD8_9AGAR|nr:hypothetical protein BDP27DRAFT_1428239 [Rhodocollybia butyracea]